MFFWWGARSRQKRRGSGFGKEGCFRPEPADVNYKRVVELDMPRLLAESQTVDALENTLDKIFQKRFRQAMLFWSSMNSIIHRQQARPGHGRYFGSPFSLFKFA